MSDLHILEVLAGYRPDGQPVVERLEAYGIEGQDYYRVQKSAAFAPGIAKDDLIEITTDQGNYRVHQHSGNLSIKVFSKADTSQWQESLSASLEKLGASIDRLTPRMMIASIHVSVGFNKIEEIMGARIGDSDELMWQYGNVYDPKTGEPLNWWNDLQNEV